ncbi:sulfurtransferase TusA family protein [Salirhabdus salicampi]|uniref:sulfurtransferase TusA family protein n=1 Tax=Salirhabdus salicampi TaxID=476102 RepID=UPI0020C396D6|nr:sulfurtransferase TusA family protein [Salirhabdus salicampi]MCP8616267.1 sulfurtransferase TusA family protein [Salirhabdus salicampi]
MALTKEELSVIEPDHLVDGIGEVCPHTLNIALKALKKAKPGEVVVEVTDHSIATKTIPAAVKMNKIAEVLGIVSENGEYKIYLKKL